MRIFLSYGHPENEICRLIREALQKRGHDVWFDEEKIHRGNDWRTKIIEGLEGSEAVISCLSARVPPAALPCAADGYSGEEEFHQTSKLYGCLKDILPPTAAKSSLRGTRKATKKKYKKPVKKHKR